MTLSLNVNWENVQRSFSTAFEETFSTNKKAHFDCVPIHLRVVDGAKSRWCNLILIDAVIFLLELQEFNEGSRRSFNQQQVLLECIVAEVKNEAPGIYQAYLDGNAQVLSEVQVEITGLAHPWNAVDSLKSVFLSDPTSKSRDKYVSIVETLLSHAVFQRHPFDLQFVFALTANHVLSAYPASNPASFPNKRAPVAMKVPRSVVKPILTDLVRLSPTEALLPQRDSARSLAAHLSNGPVEFDDSLFDDLLETQLSDQPWDYLDEWDAADVPLQNRSVSIVGASAKSEEPGPEATARPSHPLPLDGTGCTMSGEPLVHVCHSSLVSFRSLSTNQTGTPTVPQHHTLLHEPPAAQGPHTANCPTPIISAPTDLEKITEVLPFPHVCSQGVYSRRTSFSPLSFAVLSLTDSTDPKNVRTVSLDEPRDRSDSFVSIVWHRESLGNDRDSLVDASAGIACCTADSVTPVSMNVVSTAATPTPFQDNIPRPLSCWDSNGFDFDLFGEDFDLDLDLPSDADLRGSFCPIKPAPLLEVRRPTPKRPSTALGISAMNPSIVKRRAVDFVKKK